MSDSLVSTEIDRIVVIFEVTLAYTTAFVIAYYLFAYYKNRTQIPIRKRFYPLVIWIGILSLILLCILMPIIQLTNYGALNHLDPSIIPHDFGSIPSILFDICFGYIAIFILHGVLYLMLIRLFLICFHIKFSVIHHTSNVLELINNCNKSNNDSNNDSTLPSSKSLAKQISIHQKYINNKTKYGSILGALKLFAIPYLITCTVACSIYAAFGGYQWQFELVNPILLCIPIICSQVIWSKTPKFNDYFQIRREVLATSVGGLIGTICYSAFSMIYVVLSLYDIDALILQRLSYLILIVLLGHTNLFMTVWVLRNSGRHSLDQKNHSTNRLHQNDQNNMNRLDSEVDQTAYKRMENIKDSKDSQCCHCCRCWTSIHPLSHCELLLDLSNYVDFDVSRTDSRVINLVDILSDPQGFDLFVMHLAKEFSTENILAVVEMTQYRVYYQNVQWDRLEKSPQLSPLNGLNGLNRFSGSSLMDRSSETLQTTQSPNDRLIEIPEHVPKSEVIYDWELEMVDKVAYLIEKYIGDTARFQINISGFERDDVLDKYQQLILGTMHEMEGQYIFDAVRSSIMNLMHDSLRRFETTREYKMLKLKGNY